MDGSVVWEYCTRSLRTWDGDSCKGRPCAASSLQIFYYSLVSLLSWLSQMYQLRWFRESWNLWKWPGVLLPLVCQFLAWWPSLICSCLFSHQLQPEIFLLFLLQLSSLLRMALLLETLVASLFWLIPSLPLLSLFGLCQWAGLLPLLLSHPRKRSSLAQSARVLSLSWIQPVILR